MIDKLKGIRSFVKQNRLAVFAVVCASICAMLVCVSASLNQISLPPLATPTVSSSTNVPHTSAQPFDATTPTAAIALTSSPLPATQSSVSQATQTLSGIEACDCYTPSMNCEDFQTRQAAQACYELCLKVRGGDVFGLDGKDNDGLACEDTPDK